MAKKTTYEDQDYALYPGVGGIGFKENWDEISREVSGLVCTPYGYVRAYSFRWSKHQNSRIDMIVNGREHYRNFNKAFTARGLVTKAKQFAEELHRDVYLRSVPTATEIVEELNKE